MEKTERNYLIYKLRESGETYAVIAAGFDISKERVRQIHAKERRKRKEKK